MTSVGWLGRKPKGFQCTNSFKEFREQAAATKAGREHLRKHHGGTGKGKA